VPNVERTDGGKRKSTKGREFFDAEAVGMNAGFKAASHLVCVFCQMSVVRDDGCADRASSVWVPTRVSLAWWLCCSRQTLPKHHLFFPFLFDSGIKEKLAILLFSTQYLYR